MAALTAPVVGGKGTIELAAEIFGHETHRQLLYEAVRAEMLARRQGTSQTKTRGQVAGGAANRTQRGLQVLDRDVERNLLLISGPVPGPTGGLVFVREDR